MYLEFVDGKLNHPRLPLPLEKLKGLVHFVNGRVDEAKATAEVKTTASSGPPCLMKLEIHDLVPGACETLEGLVKQLDMTVEHLPVTPELFTRLPDNAQQLQHDFDPAGMATVVFHFQNEPTGQWTKHWTIQPEQATASFDLFPYRLERITGTIDNELSSGQERVINMDLVGYAGSQPVYLRGQIRGEKPNTTVALDIWETISRSIGNCWRRCRPGIRRWPGLSNQPDWATSKLSSATRLR